MKYPFITQNHELADFCRNAMEHGIVGIDTEFVWTNTYYPRFGLLQIAWDKENCALVDPLAITDAAPFKELLEKADVLKVFHEAKSDLPILRRWCGALPCNIADTRYAAGFCGLTAGMSLAKLLAGQLGVVLPKTETRTNWLRRPLTDAQLEYAGDDVTLLPSLYQKLAGMVEAAGNTACFREEMMAYEKEDYYVESSLEDCWKHVSRPKYLKFTEQDYAVLQQLAAWRENLARTKDLPKNFVIKDDFLAIAAVKHPYTAAEVAGIQGMQPAIAAKYGEIIAQIVKDAMKLPKEQWPDPFHCELDSRLVKQRSDRVLSLVAKRAEMRSIDPVLVCSRKDADSLVVAATKKKSTERSQLMNGWRHELLAPTIDEICLEYKRKAR